MAHTFFFYFFSTIAVFAAIMVISSRNTVNAVFFLILDFISVSSLFIMIGAEFLGMIMLIVYVGAVAVLFLFVVMMLNVEKDRGSLFKEGLASHIPVGILVGIVIFLELIVIIGGWNYKKNLNILNIENINYQLSNTKSLGNILYTDFILLFQISGMLLLVAMIGAIILTFRRREGIKKQNVFSQISRERSSSVSLIDVKSNEGVDIDG